jgi:hypothetical protein
LIEVMLLSAILAVTYTMVAAWREK